MGQSMAIITQNEYDEESKEWLLIHSVIEITTTSSWERDVVDDRNDEKKGERKAVSSQAAGLFVFVGCLLSRCNYVLRVRGM